ncbi:MAG: DNA polymerase III subunit beta [Firmicutes bacterium]|nr:DNA polymerase III subunit beta [Bacillota bacterium]
MKFTSTKDNLSYATQIVQKSVSSKTTIPILSGILIETGQQMVKLAATDLEIGTECSFPADVQLEGKTVVPARYFIEFVRRLPDQEITIESNSENSQITIKYGISEFTLSTMDPTEFPILPLSQDGPRFTLTQGKFKQMIKQVLIATSNEQVRPVFTGVLLLFEEGTIKLVATDTHRLAVREERQEYPLELEQQIKQVIIPARTLSELNRILLDDNESFSVTITENQILFTTEQIALLSRLIDGHFPNYKQVLPKQYSSTIKLKTKELLSTLERAALLMSPTEGISSAKFELQKDKLIVSSTVPNGSIYEELPIILEGDPLLIAFNSKYLIDVLRIIDNEEILFQFTGPLSSAVIRPTSDENYFYLVLPIRI